MNIWIQALLVFASAFLLDGIWVLYMAAARNKKALRAGLWSGSMFIFAGFNVVSYVNNHWLLAAAALGAMVGTYVFLKVPHE